MRTFGSTRPSTRVIITGGTDCIQNGILYFLVDSTHGCLTPQEQLSILYLKEPAPGIEAITKKMMSSGFPLETIASITEIDPEKVRELYNEG